MGYAAIGYGPSPGEQRDHRFSPYAAGAVSGYNSKGFPLRAGQSPCTFYLKTGECKYGRDCCWDHPEGAGAGADRAAGVNSAGLPLRPGEQPCAFYLKTGDCKFGNTCKFDHPEGAAGRLGSAPREAAPVPVPVRGGSGLNELGYPLNPGAVECAFYMKTGSCKFGATCKFAHPSKLGAGYDADYEVAAEAPVSVPSRSWVPKPSAAPVSVPSRSWVPKPGGSSGASSGLNSEGLPRRPGQPVCAFYVKTGQCKFAETCRFDHPEPNGDDSSSAGGGFEDEGYSEDDFDSSGWGSSDGSGTGSFVKGGCSGTGSFVKGGCSGTGSFVKGGCSSTGSFVKGGCPGTGSFVKGGCFGTGSFVKGGCSDSDSLVKGGCFGKGGGGFGGGGGKGGKSAGNMNSMGFPIRPGQKPCAFYVKTGDCKYGSTCIWDHPEPGSQELVRAMQANGSPGGAGLNELGYPLNPGAPECAFYMKTGTCKFGATCKFSHPSQAGAAGDVEVDPFEEALRMFEAGSTGASPAAAGGYEQAAPDGSPLNSEGLPMRPGHVPCSFFVRTGTCKYGPTCKWDHPEGAGGSGVMPVSDGLPERPGETPCAFYLKNGTCSFGATCKFDHPAGMGGTGAGLGGPPGGGGGAPVFNSNPPDSLNSKGYAVRLGEPACPFYMRSGSCMFGATCKFNHPEEGSMI